MRGLDLQDRRLWLGGGAVAALLIVLVAWTLAIHPKRSDAADLRSQIAGLQSQNTQAQKQESTLEAKSKHIDQYRSKLGRALVALPPRNALSQFTRELSVAAQRTGVKLTNITIGAPAAVDSTQPVAATPGTDPGTSSSDDTSTGTSTAGTSEDGGVAGTSAPTSSTGGPMSASITLTAAGSTQADLAFLQALRDGPRAVLITSVQLSSGDGAGSALTAQVSVFSSAISEAQRVALFKLATPAK